MRYAVSIKRIKHTKKTLIVSVYKVRMLNVVYFSALNKSKELIVQKYNAILTINVMLIMLIKSLAC